MVIPVMSPPVSTPTAAAPADLGGVSIIDEIGKQIKGDMSTGATDMSKSISANPEVKGVMGQVFDNLMKAADLGQPSTAQALLAGLPGIGDIMQGAGVRGGDTVPGEGTAVDAAVKQQVATATPAVDMPAKPGVGHGPGPG